MKTKWVWTVAGLALSAFTTALVAENTGGGANAKQAYAVIRGAGANKGKIKGEITFTQVETKLRIVGDIEGLTPGKHGIHIHEKTDLSKDDLSGAGGHFNPDGGSHKHGGPDDASRHAGDLGNLEADANGHAHLDLTDDVLSIDGPKNGVVGHSVIIHASEDDLKSQPAGNSGARVAGGAIVLRNASGKQPDQTK